jgi:DNA-binding NtrC family response regulator
MMDKLPSKKTLLVDDEESILRLQTTALESLGHIVISYSDSITALEKFKEDPDSYNLIISDMNLPNMTGKELAKQVSIINPSIPFIICSGLLVDENISVDRILMKPIRMSEFKQIVIDVLNTSNKGQT